MRSKADQESSDLILDSIRLRESSLNCVDIVHCNHEYFQSKYYRFLIDAVIVTIESNGLKCNTENRTYSEILTQTLEPIESQMCDFCYTKIRYYISQDLLVQGYVEY